MGRHVFLAEREIRLSFLRVCGVKPTALGGLVPVL